MHSLIHFFLAYLVSVSIFNVSCESLKEKYVSAILKAKWSETPLLLEASEFIFRNNPNSFWPFVNEISATTIFNLPEHEKNFNNQTYYDQILEKSFKFMSPMQFDLLKLSLSIRTYSPCVEMSRNLATEVANIDCLTFVDIHGQITCDLNKIQSLITTANLDQKPFVYQFDKFYTSNDQKRHNLILIILYSQIGSDDFNKFHTKIINLLETSNKEKISVEYVLRHNYNPAEYNENNQVTLSGYGVELDIKNQEYKAQDDTKVNAQDSNNVKSQKADSDDDSIQGFMFNKLSKLYPKSSEHIEEFRKHLLESTFELAPLKAWQTQDLSLQAAQRIIDADTEDALNILEDLSQNFPIRARSLSKIQVKKEIQKAFKSQRKAIESALNMDSGAGAFYLNGLELNIETIDIFSLSALLRKESQLIETLFQTGLSSEQLKSLVYLDTNAKTTEYGVDIRDSSIQWLNNLEKDSKYSHWGKNVQEILRPTYPGMLRSIAKNFFNLVIVIDPSKEDSKILLKTVESFFVNDIPLRIGFVFVTNDEIETDGFKEANVAIFRAHNYIKSKTGSPYKALSFITDVYAANSNNSDLNVDFIVKEFKKQYPKEKNYEDVFGFDSDYDEGRKLSMEYYHKIGLRNLPQVFLNGFPLTPNELEGDVFEESIINKIMSITPEIQMAVYKGELHDSMNLLDWIMNKDEIMPRLNPRILSQDRQYLSINQFDQESRDYMTRDIKYLLSEKEQINMLTIWAVADPDTVKGRKFLYDSINFYESSKINTRLGIILTKSNLSNDDIIKKGILFAFENFNKKQTAKFIRKILRESTFNDLKIKKKLLADLDFKEFEINEIDIKLNELKIEPIIEKNNYFLKKNTPFKCSNDMGLIANGWILGPFEINESFIDSDFSLLENFILKIGLQQIKNLITKWNIKNADDTIIKINCILGKYASSEKRVILPEFNTATVNIKPQRSNSPFYDIIVILDPLTRYSQRISTILKTITKITNINLMIYFNCKEKLSAPPLKSFYRYVLEDETKFSNGHIIKPFAYFHNMPQTPILTMNIHPPESWMVEAIRSPYDLDNICLNEIDGDGAYGEFELEHLVIEGHAFDVLSGQSPRGLQFNLGTFANPVMYDTIVMANLGYFQLKSSPGIWILQLREGRSKDIYEIVSHENTDSESKRSTIIRVVVDNFEGKVIRVKVSKKVDKLNENLLEENEKEKENSIWSSIKTSFGGNSNSEMEETKDKQDVLNIFSVASGHLYERLLRIMMLTVLKNTKAKVKFWFLKNYLSPQFTQFLPYYSQKWGFDYELVQYKWPRWLHHESEKQRIIWGYKILFLDVLFPLNVEKIIYVDADQIVKSDLTELRDLDLKGAPYGYTPFCDSRKEMEGYRFWKTGYWQMHLGHRKYHISALYVVDLKKFRKLAAGDRLRGQYQGLSQDPNSLSNLDQDLPNNMIHQVNIFSLPQEWLYCDTWCSSDTLKKAKTIDLCNNPQTKEPKLEAAVRIVPEWKDFDNEIKTLMQEWQEEQKNNKTKITTSSGIKQRHSEL